MIYEVNIEEVNKTKNETSYKNNLGNIIFPKKKKLWLNQNLHSYNNSLIYCKPTFIREREIFASYARELSSRIFLVANQPLLYGCYNNTYLYKAYSQKVVVAN